MRQTKTIKRIMAGFLSAVTLATTAVSSLGASALSTSDNETTMRSNDSRLKILENENDFISSENDLSTFVFDVREYPTITITDSVTGKEISDTRSNGNTFYTISDLDADIEAGLGDGHAACRQLWFYGADGKRWTDPSQDDFDNITITATLDHAGYLLVNGEYHEIKMVVSYYSLDLADNLSGVRFDWSKFDYDEKTCYYSGQTSYNEWAKFGFEFMDVDVQFYDLDSSNPDEALTFDNAFLTSYSLDGYCDSKGAYFHQESRASSSAKEVYVVEEGHILSTKDYDLTSHGYYKNKVVYYGTGTDTTTAGNLAAVTFKYQNTDTLSMSMILMNSSGATTDKDSEEGYHLYFTPLTATTPTAPKKSIQSGSTGVDEKNVVAGEQMYYWVDFEMPYSVASNFYVQSLSLTDTFDSNLTVNTSGIKLQEITRIFVQAKAFLEFVL